MLTVLSEPVDRLRCWHARRKLERLTFELTQEVIRDCTREARRVIARAERAGVAGS